MGVEVHERPSDPKREVSAAIARAQADLERAVQELDRLPAVDLHSIALAAHALNNFLTVSGGVVDLLIATQATIDPTIPIARSRYGWRGCRTRPT